MRQNILKTKDVQDLKNILISSGSSTSAVDLNEYLELQSKYSGIKKKLSIPILTSLEFIEMLLDCYVPSEVHFRKNGRLIIGSAAESIHLRILIETIFRDEVSLNDEMAQTSVKKYFDELISILQVVDYSSDKSIIIQKAYEKISSLPTFSERFKKYGAKLLGVNFDSHTKSHLQVEPVNKIETDSSTEKINSVFNLSYNEILAMLFEQIEPEIRLLAIKMNDYIAGIDAITLKFIIENGSLPPNRQAIKLSMKDNRKADIVRFADFFAISIAGINRIFDTKVDSNDRNKDSRTGGINKILLQHKGLQRKKITAN